jgi:hypothetical protein
MRGGISAGGGHGCLLKGAGGVGQCVEGAMGEREGARVQWGMARAAGIDPRPAGVGGGVTA